MPTTTSFRAGRRGVLRQGLGIGGLLLLAPLARAHQGHEHHHATTAPSEGYVRTTASYAIPDVKLRDTNGKAVALRDSLAAGPVILDFIFTTCDTTCPVTSMSFSQVQEALRAERDGTRLVSISIDPEQDTPPVLKGYAAKFGAGPQWQMLTGTVGDSIAVQRAFNVYRGDKMNHQPVTFLHGRAGGPWVRMEGFASAAEILREYRQLRGA